jgi:hypothetical protein
MRLFTVLSLLLVIAFSARAEDGVSGVDADAIRGIVGQQLDAFQADDSALAYSFASPTIQQKFGDHVTFMAMVAAAYDPVYRPTEVQFQGIDLSSGIPVQLVVLVDRQGKAWMAHYEMMRMEDGSWRIAGCWLEELPDMST